MVIFCVTEVGPLKTVIAMVVSYVVSWLNIQIYIESALVKHMCSFRFPLTIPKGGGAVF